jgi:hypothetical protein
MKSFARFAPSLIALVLVAGCASTNVTQQTPISNAGLPRPNQIWVYNFVANPADMPPNSSIGGQVSAPSTPPTADEIDEGRQLGALIASNLWQIFKRWDFLRCRRDPDRCLKWVMG